jgi:hypothetical protein
MSSQTVTELSSQRKYGFQPGKSIRSYQVLKIDEHQWARAFQFAFLIAQERQLAFSRFRNCENQKRSDFNANSHNLAAPHAV